jgi:hypothetical protein
MKHRLLGQSLQPQKWDEHSSIIHRIYLGIDIYPNSYSIGLSAYILIAILRVSDSDVFYKT